MDWTRVVTSACVVLSVVGCTEVPAPQPPAPAAPKPQPTSAASAPAPAPESVQRPFRLAWTTQLKPFVRGLAIGDGVVVTLGSEVLSLSELRSGNLRGERPVCATFVGAFGLFGKNRGALVCEQEVEVIGLPKLKTQTRHSLPGRAIAAAFSDASVAIAFDQGPVRVWSLKDWAKQAELPVVGKVTSLALSATGSLAAGLDDGTVVARRSDTLERLTVRAGFPVTSLGFADDGQRLFAAAGPAVVVLGETTHRFRTVAGVKDAAWIDDDQIGSVGRDGLLVLGVSDDSATSLAGGLDGNEAPIAVVVSADRKVLCAAERDGKVACHARGGIPTRGIATADRDADELRMSGRVASFVKSRLTITGGGSNAPPPGDDVRVFRYTEMKVGTTRSARWIEVGTAKVIKVDKGVVHLAMGAVTDIADVAQPLAFRTPVRLVWKRP